MNSSKTSHANSQYPYIQPDQLEYPYTQPDQLEYPGDEYVSLFPTFVSLNFTLSTDVIQVNQQR